MASATESPFLTKAAAPQNALLDALFSGQRRAIAEVEGARASLERAAKSCAAALAAGGRLVYLGAGASGLLAAQDGLELYGTFGLPDDRVAFVVPGGARLAIDPSGDDDRAGAEAAIDGLRLARWDVVIAVSASGSTPFTLAGARRGREAGALVVAIACRIESPLEKLADVAIVLDVGPEAVEGSTRLAAGTAQKAALNILSTLAFAELGHVHDGLMVKVRPENAKLRARAVGIVMRIAAVDEPAAEKAFAQTNGDVVAAIAAAAGGLDAQAAQALAAECGGMVSTVLARLNARGGTGAGATPLGGGVKA